MKFFYGVLSALCIIVTAQLASAAPTEMAQAQQWERAAFDTGTLMPFSFTYGGKPAVLRQWKRQRTSRKMDGQRTQDTIIWTDPQTNLQVRCVAVEYKDYPTTEWTLYFKNAGTADTPILENIQALDTQFQHGTTGDFILHHAVGSTAVPNDFQPLDTPLGPKATLHLAPDGGRSSNGTWPYFNIGWPNQGVVVAVGWPGQWAASFTRDETTGLRVSAGQELTHFTLHPGEEVRSPLIALQFYQGDWIRAQNVWRRWMMAHNVPRVNGQPPKPAIFGCSSSQTNQVIDTNTADQEMFIQKYLDHGLKIDDWWMDTGWYPMHNKDWVSGVGNWEVDTTRYPKGIAEISDYAHARNVGTLLWFEPERVGPETWISTHHPEWLLKTPPGPSNSSLLNLGDPAALQWLTDHISGIITSQKLNVYRQDFNMDPLLNWRGNDAPDRQGITEIKHVTGYLAYWDALLQRHPGLQIDACASGGRRLDLESMRRATPRTDSDLEFDAAGEQSQTYGISLWLPYRGNGYMDAATAADPKTGLLGNHGNQGNDAYLFRSEMFPAIVACVDVRRNDIDYPTLARLFNQFRAVSPNLLGDYYPLSDYSTANDVWMAWQFDRPEAGEGIVQAFRRGDNGQETTTYKLRGLNPASRYQVQNLDMPRTTEQTGRALMEQGLSITLTDKPGAAIVTYRKME